MSKKNTKKILAFVHIEKAAGTTLIHLLRANFFLNHCDVAPLSIKSSGVFNSKDLLTFFRLNPALRSMAGHAIQPLSDLEKVAPNIRYITLLRDPVQRYLSNFQYAVEKQGRDVSFENFLKQEWYQNFQTKKLAGSENVEVAKRMLREKFFAIGLMEQFDEFLILLKRKLEPFIFRIGYKSLNIGNRTSRLRKDINKKIHKYREIILQNNAIDMELYNFAKKVIIPKEKEAYGKDFEADVRRYKKIQENQGGFDKEWRRYADYLYRKLYLSPLVGYIRARNGLPPKGSY